MGTGLRRCDLQFHFAAKRRRNSQQFAVLPFVGPASAQDYDVLQLILSGRNSKNSDRRRLSGSRR
jgi:hypothetical protein